MCIRSKKKVTEGWKKEDSNSQVKTNRDLAGTKVEITSGTHAGKKGTIQVQRKHPTFSKSVPYTAAVTTIKLDDGKMVSVEKRQFKKIKE